AADRAAKDIADRARRFVALARALLCALHQALRVQHRRACRDQCAHGECGNGDGNETQSRWRARDRFRTDHSLVSLVKRNGWRMRALRRESAIRPDYRHHGEFVYRCAVLFPAVEIVGSRTGYWPAAAQWSRA